MEFKVEIQGLPKLIETFQKAPSIVTPLLQRSLSASGAILAKHTVKGVVPWRTGFLTQSFRAEMSDLVLRWFPTASYAPYVELGHTQQVGRYVPAIQRRLVKPFVEGNPYMERIVTLSQDEINAEFGGALEKITAALASQV